jgi:hypothetical protein
MRSKRINRQFKKTLGSESVEAELTTLAEKLAPLREQLGLTDRVIAALQRFPEFIDWIEQSFDHSDQMQEMSRRSLDASSRELFEKTLQVESLVNSLGEGFLMFGADGRCLSTHSKACREILGMVPTGRPLGEVLGIDAGNLAVFEQWDLGVRDRAAGVRSLDGDTGGILRQAGSRALP